MKKTVLITGGNGFIGKRLTEALLHKGYKVKILTRRKPKKQPVNPDVTIVQADYQNVDSLHQAMQGCSQVYHLAAAIFSFKLADFYQANAQVTHNMVKAANLSEGLEHFIYMSSLAASGFSTDAHHPRTEIDEPSPISDYGITKLEGEKAVRTLRPEIAWTIVRAPIVYGGRESGVSKIAAWVKRGLMINTSGNGLFSVVYVEDLVKALVLIPTLPQAKQEVFFICEVQDYTWPDFISKMAKAMGVRKPFMPKAPVWVLHLAAKIYSTVAYLTGTEPALNYDKVKEAVINGHWTCSGAKWRTLSNQQFTPLEEGLQQSFKK